MVRSQKAYIYFPSDEPHWPAVWAAESRCSLARYSIDHDPNAAPLHCDLKLRLRRGGGGGGCVATRKKGCEIARAQVLPECVNLALPS
jgi:hypothetical protein